MCNQGVRHRTSIECGLSALAGAVIALLLAFSAGADEVTIHNLADDSIAVYEQTKTLSPQARRGRFRSTIAPRFPAFYRPRSDTEEARHAFDERIDGAFRDFEDYRQAYLVKVEAFPALIANNVQSFKAYFEDFQPSFEVYSIHSLGGMDGDTRMLDGQFTFIFGADLMARFHDFDDEGPFFHHESRENWGY